MKKLKFLIVFLVSMFAFNINVFAASGSLSVSSDNVSVGDSFTVTANISSAAAWNIHVSSSGPVNNCTINQANATDDAMDTNKSFTATCTATAEGTINIRLSGDVTSASDGNAVNISSSKSVTVSAKQVSSNNIENTTNNNVTNNNSNNVQKNTSTNAKSKNNKLKELSVDGYELVRVNENTYTLSVSNDVTSINIKAVAEDPTAKIKGTGVHNINVGENNIDVIVTAENGTKNKINIKVTRKSEYYIEDLDSLLNNSDENINITLKSDTKITNQDLEKIKNSKKVVNFNYYNDDKHLIYSWIVDGSKLTNTDDLITTILNDSENKKDVLKLSNYADGIFIELAQKNNFPVGTKLKFFVGDKYKDDDIVNIYVKNDDKLELINNKVKVVNGYIEFETSNSYDYFVTMSTIASSNETNTKSENTSSSPILFFIIGILTLLVIVLAIVLIIKNKKDKEEDTKDKIEPIVSDDIIPINTNIDTNSSNDHDESTSDTLDTYNNKSIIDDNVADTDINDINNSDQSSSIILDNYNDEPIVDDAAIDTDINNINNHDESTSVVSDNYNNGPKIDINSNQSINSNQDNNPNSELIKLGLELYEKQIKEIDNNKKD